MCVKTKL